MRDDKPSNPPTLWRRATAWLARLFRREVAPGYFESGAKFSWHGWLAGSPLVWPRRDYLVYVPRGFSGRRFLEDQTFVLVHVARGFACHVLHRATSSGVSSFAFRTERSLSATWPTAVSMVLREVNSVQHQSEALPSSG